MRSSLSSESVLGLVRQLSLSDHEKVTSLLVQRRIEWRNGSIISHFLLVPWPLQALFLFLLLSRPCSVSRKGEAASRGHSAGLTRSRQGANKKGGGDRTNESGFWNQLMNNGGSQTPPDTRWGRQNSSRLANTFFTKLLTGAEKLPSSSLHSHARTLIFIVTSMCDQSCLVETTAT